MSVVDEALFTHNVFHLKIVLGGKSFCHFFVRHQTVTDINADSGCLSWPGFAVTLMQPIFFVFA